MPPNTMPIILLMVAFVALGTAFIAREFISTISGVLGLVVVFMLAILLIGWVTDRFPVDRGETPFVFRLAAWFTVYWLPAAAAVYVLSRFGLFAFPLPLVGALAVTFPPAWITLSSYFRLPWLQS